MQKSTKLALSLPALALTLSVTALAAQNFSEEAVQTGQDLTEASQGIYDVIQGRATADGGRQALTDFINGTSRETREFFEDTTAQFALDTNRSPAESAYAGGLNMYAAYNCASVPNAADYQGRGMSPNLVIADFAAQVSTCLSALEKVTSEDGIKEILAPMDAAFGTTLSDTFTANVTPIDQARLEAILFAVAYPHCAVNKEPTACNIVRRSMP